MDLELIEKELTRAVEALGNETYGKDAMFTVLDQTSKLANIYKTISGADIEATRANDDHDKATKECELKNKEIDARIETDRERAKIDNAKNQLEQARIDMEKERLHTTDRTENRKLDIEKAKVETAEKSDAKKNAIDEQRLILDRDKLISESSANKAALNQRKYETALNVGKDVLLVLLQVGVGIATTKHSFSFGRDVLKFEETGTVCSTVGRTVIPKLLGRTK